MKRRKDPYLLSKPENLHFFRDKSRRKLLMYRMYCIPALQEQKPVTDSMATGVKKA